jgi:hypothetical protein
MSKQPAPDVVEIEQAKRNAEIARDRVQTSVGALKQRLHPRTIASDAAEKVKERTGAIGDQARRRPGAAAAAAGVATLIVFRKPLKKIGRRLFSRKAKDERRARKEAARLDKDEKRIAKERRREEKHAGKARTNSDQRASPPSRDAHTETTSAKQE